MYKKLEKCLKSIREKTDFKPEKAVILGSGLGDYAEKIKIEKIVKYTDIEDFPVSTVQGHKGQFVFGYVEDVPVVLMQGRVHYYEGYPMQDVVLPTRLMGMMGAKKILLTNAAGGVNPSFRPGDFMLIKDHITTAVPSPLIGPNIEELGTRFPDMSEVYSKKLQDIIRKSAKDCGIPLQEGVYVQLTGPNYETPAEIRMVRSWGADAVGMSTACEAMAARHMGMEVCGISCITNMAAGVSIMTKREKELEDLFQRWMKKQGEEKGWEKTTVGGREILRIHFTKDGMVDPEAYEVSSCKILVVLKEANIADNKTEEWLKEHMIDDQRYWYREFVNGTIQEGVWTDENGCRKKSDNIPQKESIGRMAYLLQKYTKNQKIDANRPSGKEIQDAVKQVAFMNLNKRGGSQKVNEKVLNDYVEEYKNEIKEEIEILQPDYIIWCAGEKPMGKILEKKNGIEMLHPAAGRYIYRNNEELGFEGNVEKWENYYRELEESQKGAEYLKVSKGVEKYIRVFKSRVEKFNNKNKISC